MCGVSLQHLARPAPDIDGDVAGEGEPGPIVESKGLGMVSDETALKAAVDEALAANPDIADKIRNGKV